MRHVTGGASVESFGESTLVVSKSLVGNLLLSDTGIARRSDGTWVLFIKGIPSDSGCSQGSLCELCALCARNVYRTTSTNLINWSALEKVVGQASVPEAVTYPDGSVWLYHQNFARACTANDSKLALRAAITGLKEGTGYVMESGVDVFFEDEEFETNTSMHYPTNGNPIALPDATGVFRKEDQRSAHGWHGQRHLQCHDACFREIAVDAASGMMGSRCFKWARQEKC